MEVRAMAKNLSLSPKRLRTLVNPVRGKRVEEALTILQFLRSPWAREVAKLIRSAAANAENNFQMDAGALKIVRIDLGDGVTAKRQKPRARGQSSRMLRRHSHLTVVVDEED
ncbi:MAG: 50S ribosomal protein L22 [Chloroflexi bacterium]|nr:50S ribosomal protein L22 [Chloroflexota bacterium]